MIYQKKKKNLNFLQKNDVGEVLIHSSQLIPMDDFKDNQKTGRFCLLDEEEIVAGGIVNLENYPDQKEVEKTKISPETFTVTEIDRALKFNHRSAIIWMTGFQVQEKQLLLKKLKKIILKRF